MRRLAAPLLAALLSTVAGCTLTTDVSKLDPYQDLESFCPVLFDQVVARFDACDPMAPALRDQLYGTALQGCARLAAGEQAGRLGYDEAAARACIDQLASPSCRDFGLACDAVLVPRVALGGACQLDVECGPAAEGCYSPDLSCPGHCLPGGGAGDACGSFDPPCGPDFYCGAVGGPPICLARAADGQPCGGTPCRPGSTCVSGACQPQQGVGGLCSSDTGCDSRLELFCDAGVCAAPPTVGGTANAPCGFPRFCADGYSCDFSGAQPLCKGLLDSGVACTQGSQCRPPGSCLPTVASGGTASACQVPGRAGDQCLVGAQGCARGLFCGGGAGGSIGTCRTWPGVGGACGLLAGERVDCLGGWCDTPASSSIGTCRAIKPAGAACAGDEECALDGFLSPARCVGTPGGSVCTKLCR